MVRLRSLLFVLSVLASPALLRAQSASLKICNNAEVKIDVAVAARIQYIITGYRWETTGWYVVKAHDCEVVYSETYEEAGLITPQSEARVAYGVTNSKGAYGAYHSGVIEKGGWIHSGSGDICVKPGDAFHFTEPAGDPAANCNGMLMPVSDEFLPPEAGKYTLTIDWNGDKFFVPLTAPTPPVQPRPVAPSSAPAAPPAPVAPPPAPPPPPPPPAEPADDPIGGGGFIQPPSSFNAQICVPSNLINSYGWNNPAAGSKMEAFKNLASRTIASVAKPGWEYWVLEAQFMRFNPQTATSGDALVAQISPDSGRFDEFNPGCPAGYALYNLPIKR